MAIWRRLGIALGLCLTGWAASPAAADEILYVEAGSAWRYRQGLEEPSSPDPDAWKLGAFDPSSWPTGAAPFGYGDAPFGTDVSGLDPAMRGRYSTFYIRRVITVGDASRVSALEADVNYDDGFVLWINGVEVARANMPGAPGDPVAHDDFADVQHESGEFETFVLPDPSGYLVDGDNVVALVVLNNQINSSDLKIDLVLVDPIGEDVTPPRASLISPPPGSTLRQLEWIEVTFNESVTGVDAGDLLVDGAPAAGVAGSGRGPYRFEIAPPSPGPVEVAWSAETGIGDGWDPPNLFEGGSWAYTVDPDAPAADLVIHEVLAANRTGITDEDGDSSDWIEISNRGGDVVSLAGWSLSDDAEEPDRWILPAISLGPGQLLLVFASGKDRTVPDRELHASFRLEADGEFLGLWEPGSPRRLVSSFAPRMPEQRADVSWGLDGAGVYRYFERPTPGAPNDLGSVLDGVVADPVFSAQRGYYTAPFLLAIASSTPGATIRCTLDGSEPGPTRGTVYGAPIEIRGESRRAAMVVRAVAYRTGYLTSRSVAHTFVFPELVLDQPDDPAGFPSSWGGAPAVDYGMDPQIVGDARYTDRIRQGLRSLPVVSIATEMASIFGSGGLYSNPGGEGLTWERAASAELFYPPGVDSPGGRQGFGINCGLRIQGGASRTPSKSPKHSFRLLFKGIYGPTRLRYPLFEGSLVDDFDTVTLRAGYNNSWIHWDSGQRSRCQYIRDQWARDVLLEMGNVQSHGTFVHLFVNGLYWGLYNLVERPSAPFAASHLGGEKEEYDAFNSGSTVDGNRDAWNGLLGIVDGSLASDARYRQLEGMLDTRAFCDYMLVNFYGGNDDWPSHNWYCARRRDPDARFHFFSWDAERILEDVNRNRTGADNGNTPGEIHQAARAHPEYRLLFADRVARHLFGSGPLSPDGASAVWERRAVEIETAVAAECARWGDYRRDVHSSSNGPYLLYTPDAHWEPERQRLLAQYFPQRPARLLTQLRSAGLWPSVGVPEAAPPGGRVPAGTSLSIDGPGGAQVYYTLDGTDPRVAFSGGVSGSARAYSGPLPIETTMILRARARDGDEWGPLLEEVYTVPELYEDVHFTELHYHPIEGRSAEFLELTNAGAVAIDLSGARFTDGIELEFGAGSALAAGERLVLVADVEGFTSRYPGVEPGGVYGGSLSNAGERVTLVDPRDEEIATVRYRDSGLWPVGPDGFGPSLVRASLVADPDRPDSWRASAQAGGAPGAIDPPPADGDVLIHEVLSRSPPPLEDAIELLNPTDRAIDVGGWFLSDDRTSALTLRKYRIPDGTTIAPGGFVVFYEGDFGREPDDPLAFALNGSGDDVYLSSADAEGELTGHVVGLRFRASDPGVSLGRVETSGGSEWAALEATTFGMDLAATVEEFRRGEGAPNALPRVPEIVIHEIHYHPGPGGVEFVELLNPGAATVSLHDADIGRGWRIDGISDASGEDPWEFPALAEIDAGGYLLLVPTDPATFRTLHDVPAGVPIFGPFGGALDNGGERLRLLRPAPVEDDDQPWVVVDQVRYDDRAPWPTEADGGGPSLERVDPAEFGSEPLNWAPSEADGGTPGLPSGEPPPPNEPPVARASADPTTGEAPLRVHLDAGASFDPDGVITSFRWDFGDGTIGSGEEVDHDFLDEGEFPVTLVVRDDRGAEDSVLLTVLVRSEAAGGWQRPGDCNQDGGVDISDSICILGHLFLGSPSILPCEGGRAVDEGNRTLLDVSGDARVDLTDAVYVLLYLFQGGPPPAGGIACVRIPTCPDVCVP